MNHRLLLGVALLGVLLTRATDPASAQLRQTTIWDAAAAGSLSDVERAIAEGADVNARDQRGSTPLVYASNAGRVDVAAALLRAGADVDRTNRGRSTPLAFAAAAGHGKLVRLLLRRGANPNSRAPAGVTPLHLAVHFNHPSIARLLLEGGANLHLKARPPEGHPMTPLLVAVDHGHLEMVDLLLSHGAGVRRTGRRELDVFSSTADDAPLRGLPSDAQPETVFSDLKHAFVHAARTERIGVIKRLLTAWRRRRRIPPAADPFKDSELCRAAADGDWAAVQRLMSGSDPPPMPELARALQLARREGRIEVGSSLRRIAQRRARRAIAEYETEEDLREAAGSEKPGSYRRTLALLLRGVNVNAADISGRTALHRAASAGNVEKVDLLLNHGADPGRRDHTGRTPLSRASGDTEHEIIRLLIEHGARPDARTLGRAMAIRAGDATREMIEDLLSRGADPNAAAYTGRTALMHAAEAGNTEVVRLLIERGENVNLTSESGLTARMLAENEFHDRAAAILRDAGAIDRPNVAPNPLYRAINRKDIRRVRRLIAEGVDVNRSGTTDNRSPLWMAVIQGHKRIAGLLLDAGAKAIPVYLLVSRGDGSTRSVQLMRRLIERGADVNARRVIPPRYASDWRWQGATPLMFAAHHGKLSYVQPLLKAGASLDIEDEEGRTALARIFHQF